MTHSLPDLAQSKRDIVFVGTSVLRAPHFEVQLELMMKHAESGARLTFIACNGDAIDFCGANPLHRRIDCRICVAKREKGLRIVGLPVNVVDIRDLIEAAEAASPFQAKVKQDFATAEELRTYVFDGLDCGEAATSSLITALRKLDVDVEKYRDHVNRAVRSSVAAHKGLRYFFRERATGDTLVYIFNGRGAVHRGALRAAQFEGVDFYTHERGSHVSWYLLVPGTVPHNVDYRKTLIEAIWAAGENDPNREAIGRQFFEDRRAGIINYNPGKKFLRHQEQGALPDGWLDDGERLVILGTTESERAALRGFYDPGFYRSQAEGMCRIVEGLAAANFKGIATIRLHPNSRHEIGPLEQKLRAYQFPFLRVVGASDKTDTYSLIATATKVAVFWSNAGIEAAYHGLPVVLVGRAMYEGVGSTYNPRNHEELIELLLSPLAAKDPANAIKYGYYMEKFGIPLTHVKLTGQHRCRLNGKRTRPPVWLLHLRSIMKSLRLLRTA
jgi:hypothetical protein